VNARAARLVDVILCDDVRQENNGKLMLIGVYTGDVVIFGLPTVLPTFTVICKWATRDAAVPAGDYELLGPSGQTLHRIEAKDGLQQAKNDAALAILQFRPFAFAEAGRYRLTFRPEGGRRRALTEFLVELQKHAPTA
jgi:Family of unknown function (DUF6941)